MNIQAFLFGSKNIFVDVLAYGNEMLNIFLLFLWPVILIYGEIIIIRCMQRLIFVVLIIGNKKHDGWIALFL